MGRPLRTAEHATDTAPVPEAEPLVTVVVPVRNAEDTVGQQLAALAAQDFAGPWEVVVADNGSSDRTLEVVRRWEGRLPSLRVVRATRCRGVSHARNVGAAAARADLVAFCDGDDVAEPGWLSALVAASPDWDIVGGAFDEVSLNPPAVLAWREPRPADELAGTHWFRGYAVGANCAVWTRVIADLGGWNEGYVNAGNDVEFSWRAQDRGHRVGFVPEAVMGYRHRSGLASWARQSYHRGRASTHLYAEFRSRGMRPASFGRLVRTWSAILLGTPLALGSRARRGRWVGELAAALGRIRGSIERRVLYL